MTLPVLVTMQPATAATIDLTCPGAITFHFTPGLTELPRAQTVTGDIVLGTSMIPGIPCSSVTGQPYQGATATLTGTGIVGCVGGSASGSATLTWNNNETSTVEWSLTAVPPVPVFSATVTSGALDGSTILAGGFPTGGTGICVVVPMTSLSGVGDALFIRL